MATILIGGVVLAVIGFALYSTLRTRKKGGCGCGCGGCDKQGKCH